jgi:spermidine synthase
MKLGEEIHRCRDALGEINVYQTPQRRTLCFGTPVEQSVMSLADPALLLFDYTRTMMLGTLFVPRLRHALVLGLGGGSLARCLHDHFPDCRITAVEQRKQVVRVARDWFALPDDRRLGIHVGDAATFLSTPGKAAGLIFADLYHAEGMDEQQTDTRFFHQCRERLADGGVAVFNLWSGRYFRDQAFNDPLPRPDPKQLLEQARALGQRLGFDLHKEASKLWELNKVLLQV